MRNVYITGMSVTTAIGAGVEAFWKAMLAGTSGIGPVTRFDTSWLPVHVAAEIKDIDALGRLRAEEDSLGLAAKVALATARDALDRAGLLGDDQRATAPDMDLLMSTIHGEMNDYLTLCREYWDTHDADVSEQLVRENLSLNVTYGFLLKMAEGLGLSGMQSINTNACAASGYAVSLGVERIRQGRADIVLCGGVDMLSQADYAGFCSLRALSPDHCRPFDRARQGLVIGEGCGVIVLESGESMRRRGVQPLARIAGYGWSADAHHLSAPHPEGRGTLQSLRQALADAALSPQDICGIVAHGTGTLGNDRIEARAFAEIFGAHTVPVTAPKSMLGHAMGAASVIEAVTAVLALTQQTLPPTIGHQAIDPDCPIDVVSQKPRVIEGAYCLSNSSGFGGNNDSLIFGLP